MSTYQKIEVVEYNPKWSAMFEEEKSVILDALRDNCAAIHHVGSTSVPGLIAKPKIDIVVAAHDRKEAIAALEKISYPYVGEWNIPLQCGFAKRIGTQVNLHMFFEENHPEIEMNLAFRDYLRTHEKSKNAYANLKKEILKYEENRTKRIQVGALSFPFYTLQKRAFIDNIFRKIGPKRLRVIKCLTNFEQNAAKKFYTQKFGRGANIDFSNKNYEHFMLYKGVDICGYAQLNLETRRADMITQNSEDESFFCNFIQKWFDTEAYKR